MPAPSCVIRLRWPRRRQRLTHLKGARPVLQRELNARTTALVERLNGFFEACDAPMRAVSFSSLWRVRVDEAQPFASLFYYALRERGLHVYEQFNCFLTEAHGDAEVDAIATRIQSAVGELMDAGILTERGTTSHASARRVSDSAPKKSPLTSGTAGSTDLPVEVPMTEGQMEKWLACQYGDDANIAFNEAFVLTLDGPLNELALERALAAVSLRHEAFALSFLPDGSGQRLNSRKALPLAMVDLSGDASEAKIASYCAAATCRPFDLTCAPLVRVELLRLGPDRNAMLVVAHHLVFDGWSAAVFLDEIARVYTGYVTGVENELEPAESYRAYALAERERSSGGEVTRQIDYWKRIYSVLPDPLTLPADFAAPSGPDFAASTVRHEFPEKLVAALKLEARRSGVTFYSLLLASFGVLVSRLSGQQRFCRWYSFCRAAIERCAQSDRGWRQYTAAATGG